MTKHVFLKSVGLNRTTVDGIRYSMLKTYETLNSFTPIYYFSSSVLHFEVRDIFMSNTTYPSVNLSLFRFFFKVLLHLVTTLISVKVTSMTVRCPYVSYYSYYFYYYGLLPDAIWSRKGLD